MALNHAPRLLPAPGPSLRVLDGRKRDSRSVIADLRDELTAAGQEMRALGCRIEYAIASDRPDLALHIAARLQVLGESYANPTGGTDDAA